MTRRGCAGTIGQGEGKESEGKERFVRDPNECVVVQHVFLVEQKLLKTSKKGSFYLDVTLSDRTGSVNAKFWDATRSLHESFGQGDFILVRANVESYQGRPQLIISNLKKVPDEEVELADFLPASERDPKEMEEELRALCARVEDEHLGKLLEDVFDDEFLEKFSRCPAAVSLHHSYLGGLMEHTLSVATMALDTVARYDILDKDLMLAGALLHDIGKVEEIEHGRAFRYSDRGSLVGHLVIGAWMVRDKALGQKDFPQGTLMQIEHIILSHHGQYEFGSPKLPATAEAFMVYYIDNLDAKMNQVTRAIEQDLGETNWTDWKSSLKTRLYRKRIDQ